MHIHLFLTIWNLFDWLTGSLFMDYKRYTLVYLSSHDFVAVVVTWTLTITFQKYTLQNHMVHVSILIWIARLDYDIKTA
jgi:hypothetical protein